MSRPDLHIAGSRDLPAVKPGRSAIRVLLADDHAKVRTNVRRMLESEHDVEVVADIGDVSNAAAHAEFHRPDVLILDLHVPDTSAIALTRLLRARFPKTQILILTMEGNAAYARQVLNAGAIGYVLKEHADTDLVTAVRLAHAGRTFVSASIAAGLELFETAPGVDGLTSRELEVLRLTALGYTAVEIARSLNVSSRTVETHRANLHAKLQLRSRAELVRYALGRGLLDSEIPERDVEPKRYSGVERGPAGL